MYNLYDRLSVGGFVVIDDFIWADGNQKPGSKLAKKRAQTLFGAKNAVLDFMRVHSIHEPMKDVDGKVAYFKKTAPTAVKRDLYLEALRKKAASQLTGSPALTGGDYFSMWQTWEEAGKADTERQRTTRANNLQDANSICRKQMDQDTPKLALESGNESTCTSDGAAPRNRDVK